MFGPTQSRVVSRDDRAVSPVIATILMVAVLVVLSATASTVFLGVGSELRDPAPTIAQSSGTLVAQEGTDGGIVTITHVAGDTVPVSELAVASDACGERERLVNLPEDPSNNAGRFADTNVASGDISESIVSGGFEADLRALDSRTDNDFSAGSALQFRLTGGACPLDPGDRVIVRVVHAPSNSVLVTKTLVV